MHVDTARSAIASASGTAPHVLEPIPGGWDFDVFRVDHDWIYRFPKRPSSARALEAELRLLSHLQDHMSIRVPAPEVTGEVDQLPFVGYRRIPGRPLLSGDSFIPWVRSAVLDAIDQLHSFDLTLAASVLGVEDPMEHWVHRCRRLVARAESDVAPLLDHDTRHAMRCGLDVFENSLDDIEPTFIHADLGPAHILIDDSSLSIGLIDFGDATVGDPAIDYVGLWIACGPDVASSMLESSSAGHTADTSRRVASYWWLGSVHAILYGIDEDDYEVVADGVKGLTERLAELDS